MSNSNTEMRGAARGSGRLRQLLVWLLALGIAAFTIWMLQAELHWFEKQHAAIVDLRRAKSGDRVRIAGTVSFVDANERMIFVQDESAGLQLRFGRTRMFPKAGDRIELQTIVLRSMDPQQGLSSMQFAAADVQSVQRGSLLLPEPMQLADLATTNDARNARRVQTQGVVRNATRNGDRLRLELAESNEQVVVTVLNASRLHPNALIDARL